MILVEDPYSDIVHRELTRMCCRYGNLLSKLTNDNSLKKEEVQALCKNYSTRIISAKVFVPHILAAFQDVTNVRLPLLVIHTICEFVKEPGPLMNPLCITTWESDAFQRNIIGEGLVGHPPYAIEFRKPKTINVCRDDIDLGPLTDHEKMAFKINTKVVDEILSSDPRLVGSLQGMDILDSIGIQFFLCVDVNGNPFILAFFFTNFFDFGDVLEFGYRMDLPSNESRSIIEWIHKRNIELNFTTGEIIIEEF